MPKSPALPILIIALISGGLFMLVFGLGLGFLFMFMPTLPLLTAGMGSLPRVPLLASLAASIMVAIFVGPSAAFFYLLFFALPACYIAHQAVLYREFPGDMRQWFPLGLIFLNLTLYACAAICLAVLIYTPVEGGLPAILAQHIKQAFSDLGDEYAGVVDSLANRLSFLVFSITAWLWGLALYAHGWLANRALIKRGKQIRPNFVIRPFEMPVWMLSLLLIAALASLVGSPSMRFAGETSLITLLLPYFFLGASVMHHASLSWQARRFFLFFMYFIIFSQFWPALGLAALGLWQQLKGLTKHLPEGKA